MSPIICYATFAGLAPATKISFTITSTVTIGSAVTTYTTTPGVIAGGSYSFLTPSAPSSAPNTGYPLSLAAMADAGQSFNTSLTAQYINAWGATVGGITALLNAGDLTYADTYGAASDDNRWDTYATMWNPVFGAIFPLGFFLFGAPRFGYVAIKDQPTIASDASCISRAL